VRTLTAPIERAISTAVEDLVEGITRGNPTEVKVVLASVVLALACYQLVLIAVGYGKLRPSVLQPRPATRAHRATGDAIVVIMVVVALMCLSYFGFEDDETVHVVAGTALLAVLALKIAVIRRWHRLGRFLPLLGLSVFVLLGITWLSSAGAFLADG
jgi:small-conductance mechanosensitive channel